MSDGSPPLWQVRLRIAAPFGPELLAAADALDPLAAGAWEAEGGSASDVDLLFEFDHQAKNARQPFIEKGFSVLSEETAAVAQQDWVALSQRHLTPVRAGRFFVHGAHDRAAVPPAKTAIEIDAGQAFGTGHHETTRGCLLLMERLLKRKTPRTALDLGTGSGVLAIALAKRTKRPVIASDIDPVAAETAHANARLNGAAPFVRTLAANGLAHEEIRAAAPFDLILANILARPLIALAPKITHHSAPGGHLILSGLLTTQERAVEAAYHASGWRICERCRLGGWSALLLVRRDSGKGRTLARDVGRRT